MIQAYSIETTSSRFGDGAYVECCGKTSDITKSISDLGIEPSAVCHPNLHRLYDNTLYTNGGLVFEKWDDGMLFYIKHCV